jgi:cytidylate kinase
LRAGAKASEQTGCRDGDRVVTIDGPSGAGKSTAARLLAARLDWLYVDTGAMYRAVALAAARTSVAPDDDAALGTLCDGLDLQLIPEAAGLRVLISGEDVSEAIRRPEIASLASAVSARRPVREAMWLLQRAIGARGEAVFEGRDTGTVVLPGACWKFWLTAAPEVRAARRRADLVGRGIESALETVMREMLARDEADSARQLAPLKPAEDAVVVDSSRLGAHEVVELMLQAMGRVPGRPGVSGCAGD